MKKTLLLIAATTISVASLAQCSDIYFSEYIEGSSNNKALEIYNPTSQAIDLSTYVIYRSNNGSATPSDTLMLTGILNSGDVYVAANPSADPTGVTVHADTLHSITFYNGDDALELYKGTTLLDVIGVVGTDPGSMWSVDTGSTKEYTLVRKPSINEGNTNWLGEGDTEWIAYSQDDFSFLGSHTADACGTTSSPLTGGITLSANTFCLGTTINYAATVSGGTAPYSTIINFGDGSTSATLSGTHTYITAGTFTLTYSASDDAIPSEVVDSTITIVVDECSSIYEDKENAISVYPNPSRDGIVNLSNVVENSAITVFNVIGEVVYSKVANGNNQINLAHLNKGSYFVSITNEKNKITKKLIIE